MKLEGEAWPRPTVIYVQPVGTPQYNFMSPRNKKGMTPVSPLPSSDHKTQTEMAENGLAEFSEVMATKDENGASASVELNVAKNRAGTQSSALV